MAGVHRGTDRFQSVVADRLTLAGQIISQPRKGKTWYVDADDGVLGAAGSSWDRAFKTMTECFAVLGSGDLIVFVGKIREQLVAPVQIFDVTILGGGNRPRHADAAPASARGGMSGATWTTPASGSTNNPLLTVEQQGWRVANFVMAGHATNACVLLLRNGGSGNSERDASHFESVGVRYASGRDGIEQSGGCYNVGVYDSDFHDLTGFPLKNTAGAGIADPFRWDIKRNRFQKCANWMGTWNAHGFEIMENKVTEITTPGLNTAGGSGHNVIADNYFDIAAVDFDPVGGFTGHATDIWSNTLKDAVETGLPAN